MSTFAENLRQAIFNKRCKAVDVSRGTNIRPSVISRYLSGTNQPSTGNLFAIAEFLGVSPNTLLSSSEAPESTKDSQAISSIAEPLLKTIEVQDKLIKNLENEVARLKEKVKEWEDWKASSKARHAKGKAKADQAISKNKQKLGFLKKHKPKK